MFFLTSAAGAQNPVAVQVISLPDSSRLAGALLRGDGITVRTGTDGQATVTIARPTKFIVARFGFAPDSVTLEPTVPLQIVGLERATEMEAMVIAATRSERRIEDDPLRVEILGREEIEEKIRMTPGDITMMMNETPGLRVQTTSPSLGGAAVRVQGLRGRYTQILSDGLPLFGGQTTGLGLLQIPPMDLGGVEVIKGVASALYGGNALGGVINLRSRVPGDEPIAELLINQTMLHGSDAVGFGGRQLGGAWSGTLLTGYHRQARRDVDGDLWSDLPEYDRFVVRPRLFWNSTFGHSVMLTGGVATEDREGGIPRGTPISQEHFIEGQNTDRYDFGGVGRWDFGPTIFSARGSVSRQRHRHQFGETIENDRHQSTFGEIALTHSRGTATFTGGLAVQNEQYRNNEVGSFDFRFSSPAIFAQTTFEVTSRVAITASARLDAHTEYGDQVSPRLSALWRAPAEVTARLSFGEGFFAPTALTEETEVTGLTPVSGVLNLVAERARTVSADIGRTFGVAETNLTLFRTVVRHPVGVRSTDDPGDVILGKSIRVENADGPMSTAGIDAIMRLTPEPWHVTLSYTFVDAKEQPPGSSLVLDVPLTPRHQAGAVAAWESEIFRAGLEIYYTGKQFLGFDAYREKSVPYTHVGVLAERRFGSARVFINAENLLGFRMTEYHPLVRPTRGPGGRWTVDAWGPLEGRTANIGVRW